jgi:hypothetical protein
MVGNCGKGCPVDETKKNQSTQSPCERDIGCLSNGESFVIQQEQDGTLSRIKLAELDLDAKGYVFVGFDSLLPRRPGDRQ